MPIYEYKCDNGHVFDALQRMSEDPLTKCTECGAAAHRVLTPVAIHFKGSGFHNTDYRKSGGDGSSESGGGSGGSGEGSSSSSESSSTSSDGGGSSGSSGGSGSSSNSGGGSGNGAKSKTAATE